MGLFGKSFEEKVAAALDQVRAMNLGVTNLDATVAGKIVTLTGETSTPEAKGRVMQEFNALIDTENTLNTIRVARPPAVAAPAPAAAPIQAEAPPLAAAAAAAALGAIPKERWHEVVKGETLSKISKSYYGDGNKYRKIFDANRDVLDNPDLIKVGQKLRIPE